MIGNLPLWKPLLQFLLTPTLDQAYLLQWWYHQRKDFSWFPPLPLGIHSLKFLNVVSRSLQEEPVSAQVQIKPVWTSVSACYESLSLIKWNRNVSLSASLIHTWEKACLIMSPHKATGLRRFWTSTLQSKLNLIEVAQSPSNHSIKGHLGLPLLLHQRQYALLYSVLLLVWLLCVGEHSLSPWVSLLTLSTIPFFSWFWIILSYSSRLMGTFCNFLMRLDSRAIVRGGWMSSFRQ